jgi:hypothetical protein
MMKMMKWWPLLFALSLPAAGQTLNVYPVGPLSVPIGSYQTLTSIVTGVNNKGVTYTTDHGTLIGVNACVVNEPCSVAIYDLTARTDHVTATTTVGAVAQTVAVTFTASPTPRTDHPRFLLTTSNLAAIQAKMGVAGTNGGSIFRTKAISILSDQNAIWGWTCGGGTGTGTGLPSSPQFSRMEVYAWYYAEMANIYPTDSYNWGCYAHDVGVYEMVNYNNGNIYPAQNEWGDESQCFAFMTDLMLGAGVLNSTEQGYARTFLMGIAKQVASYFAYPAANVTLNSSAVFQPPGSYYALGAMRQIGSNYNQAAMLITMAAALTFNDTTGDDPTLSNCSGGRYTVCSDYSANSLHAYWTWMDGGWLYQWWANTEDPTVAWDAYQLAYSNLPTQPQCYYTDEQLHPCFGGMRDGESAEGSGYGYSLYRAAYMLAALSSAGWADPILWGPQASAPTSSWWDLKVLSDRLFLTTANANNGNAWTYLHTGDTNSYKHFVSDAQTESALLTFDYNTGRTDRTNSLEWLIWNYAQGGPLGTSYGCTGSYCGIDTNLGNDSLGGRVVADVIIATPAVDPQSITPTDPLSSMPLDYYNASLIQHQMVRSSSSINATFFTDYWPNTQINHEHQWAGMFDLSANGEYFTKHRTEFDGNYNDFMSTQPQSNGVGIVNSAGSACTEVGGCFPYWVAALVGGQFWQASQAGIAWSLQHSELPAYAAALEDTTPFYNGALYSSCGSCGLSAYNDVTAASRSIVYLRGSNQIALYDRATVGHAASTQALYQNTTGAVTITGGNTASWLTRSATQKAYFTSLLPSGGTMTDIGLTNYVSTSAPYGNLQNGTTMQVTCTGTNGDGTTPNLSSSSQTQWITSNGSVATVSSTGLVTGTGLGTAIIECVYQGQTATGNVTVISGASSGSWTNQTASTTQLPDWELASTIRVTPSGTPTSTQFLNVLEFGASSLSKSTTTLVQSTSGQAFDGSLIGSSLVMFMRAWPTAFTGTTFAASGATTVYVSDLTPNTSYVISGSGTPSSATTDTAGVLTFAATGTGNITVGASGSSAVIESGNQIWKGNVTQQ